MNKYRNKPVKFCGESFQSTKEGMRYLELVQKLNTGEIRHLQRQPQYELMARFTTKSGEKVRALRYAGDFKYWDVLKEKWIVEDVKGMRTEVYRIKRKLLLRLFEDACYADHEFVEIN